MKKFFKALALVLALALVIGVVPAQATSAKIKAKKTLYVDGAQGKSTDGTKASSIKGRVAIWKLAGDTKELKEGHTYKAVIKEGDSVTVSKKYVYAAALGKSVVEIFKDGESLGTSVITVKKNATDDTLTITDLENGKEVVCGVTYTVTLPRVGKDTDERRLIVDGTAVKDKEDAARAYEVKFKKSGDHTIKYEAFQSETLDAATASKEITVKAVMPKPVSAKQVSATSFAVEFEGNMEELITKDDITNQMIYYMIASEPVVTGVIKSVEVKDAVVTVTMYAALNNNETYYFAYGDAAPVSFKTATNELKYVDSIELVPESAYFVEKAVAFGYKLYNADGVALDNDKIEAPAFTIDSDVAWFEDGDTKIYFFAEGTATVKATLTIGYDEVTNEAITKTASMTVTGVKPGSAALASKQYSFNGDYTKEIHTLRLGDTGELEVNYKYTDGTESGAISPDLGTTYYLKSTDETRVIIRDNGVYDEIVPVQKGSATIVLYDKDDTVIDAFPITVLDENQGKTATVTLTQPTYNQDGTVAEAVQVKVTAVDLDGNAYKDFKVTVEQLANNDKVSGLAMDKIDGEDFSAGGHGDVTADLAFDKIYTADKNTTVRMTVKVVDNYDGTTVLANTNLSLVVGNYAPAKANSYKLEADQATLDTSLKNYGEDDDFVQTATVTLKKVYTTGSVSFNCGPDAWEVAPSNKLANIPTTAGSDCVKNYVVFNFPTSGTVLTTDHTDPDPADCYVQVTNFSVGGDLKDNRTKASTYQVTGYHIEYKDKDGTGVHKMISKSSLGNASVVVSSSDVAPTFTILDGTAKGLNDAIAAGGTALNNIFRLSWSGLDNKDLATARVLIADVADMDYEPDANGAIFVKSIVVTVYPSAFDDAAHGGADDRTAEYATITVKVNKLFKDK